MIIRMTVELDLKKDPNGVALSRKELEGRVQDALEEAAYELDLSGPRVPYSGYEVGDVVIDVISMD